MKNITIALDEQVVESARSYAARHHTTLNGLIRTLLDRTLASDTQTGVFSEFFQLSDTHPGNSRGETWTRDELYDV